MGLVQRIIETAGIATISLFNFRPHAECVKPPRVVLVNYPFGALWGPPSAPSLQDGLIYEVLESLQTIQVPGTIREAPFEWVEPGSCEECAVT